MAEITEWQDARYLVALSRHMEGGLRKHMKAVEERAVRSVSRFQPWRRAASGRKVGLDPSREGEPPKVLEGELRRNIRGEVRRIDSLRIEGVLIAATKYARRLELGFHGTDRAGRRVNQGPRPYLRPAIVEERGKLAGRLARG